MNRSGFIGECFRSCWGVLVMVVGLLFSGWDISYGFEKSSVVEPVHVFDLRSHVQRATSRRGSHPGLR